MEKDDLHTLTQAKLPSRGGAVLENGLQLGPTIPLCSKRRFASVLVMQMHVVDRVRKSITSEVET